MYVVVLLSVIPTYCHREFYRLLLVSLGAYSYRHTSTAICVRSRVSLGLPTGRREAENKRKKIPDAYTMSISVYLKFSNIHPRLITITTIYLLTSFSIIYIYSLR